MATCLLGFLLGLARSVAGITPNLAVNMTFSDMHPFIHFMPNSFARNSAFSTVTDTSIWNISYSETPWSSYVPGMMGTGVSKHSMPVNSTEDIIKVKVPFYGRGIYFHGKMNGGIASKDILVDMETESMNSYYGKVYTRPTDDVIAGTGPEPPYSAYAAALSAPGNWTNNASDAEFSITGVTLALGLRTDAPTFGEMMTVKQSFVVDGAPNGFFIRNGNWTVSDKNGGAGGQAPIAYDTLVGRATEISSKGPDAPRAFFNVPVNTSLLILNGTMGPDHGVAGILTSPLPESYKSTIGFDNIGNTDLDSPDQELRFAYSPWIAKDAVYYLAVLDPQKLYNVTIAAKLVRDTDRGTIGLHSVTFYSGLKKDDPVQQPDVRVIEAPPAKLAKGSLAGIIVGSILGALLIGALAYFLAIKAIRRRHQRLSRGDPATFVIDHDVDHGSPFNSPIDTKAASLPFRSPLTEKQSFNLPAPVPEAGPSQSSSSSISDAASPVVNSPIVERLVIEQAQDGGAIHIRERVEVVPPQYNPNWSSGRDDLLSPQIEQHEIRYHDEPTSPERPLPMSPTGTAPMLPPKKWDGILPRKF